MSDRPLLAVLAILLFCTVFLRVLLPVGHREQHLAVNGVDAGLIIADTRAPPPCNLIFSDRGETVATLFDCDEERRACYQRGDIAAAYRVLRAEFDRVAEERDRLKWGNAQVDAWKREAVRP